MDSSASYRGCLIVALAAIAAVDGLAVNRGRRQHDLGIPIEDAQEQSDSVVVRAAQLPQDKVSYDGCQVWRVRATGEDSDLVSQLEETGDLSTWAGNSTTVDVLVRPETIPKVSRALRERNVNYDVVISDLQKEIERENPQPSAEEMEELQGRKGDSKLESGYWVDIEISFDPSDIFDWFEDLFGTDDEDEDEKGTEEGTEEGRAKGEDESVDENMAKNAYSDDKDHLSHEGKNESDEQSSNEETTVTNDEITTKENSDKSLEVQKKKAYAEKEVSAKEGHGEKEVAESSEEEEEGEEDSAGDDRELPFAEDPEVQDGSVDDSEEHDDDDEKPPNEETSSDDDKPPDKAHGQQNYKRAKLQTKIVAQARENKETREDPDADNDKENYGESGNDKVRKIKSVEEKMADKLAKKENNEGHRMEWTSYHPWEDIEGYLDYLAQTYPEICSVRTIGKSVEDRNLKVLRISNGKEGLPALWIDGGIHAREWISPAAVTYVINYLVENSDRLEAEFYVLPVVNPDGYVYTWSHDRLWRKNRSNPEKGRCAGVDLNRNFGYKWGGMGSSKYPCREDYGGTGAFSEPETAAIRDFFESSGANFKAFLTFHSYGQYILYPWGYDRRVPPDYAQLDKVGRTAAMSMKAADMARSSYTVGNSAYTLYPASGGADDWAKAMQRIKYSYTVELRDSGKHGFVLPARYILPTSNEALALVKTVTKACQAEA